MSYTATDYLETVHIARGIGYWRQLYLDLFSQPFFLTRTSIVDLGAGTPDFLMSTNFARRVAVDAGTTHEDAFHAKGIDFHALDLEKDPLEPLGKFDIAICSDVFEHLLWPGKALAKIPQILSENGVFISHVPNEYSLVPTLLIMAGLRTGMYFHKDQKEWTDPHIRRFTDRGYKEFLATAFRYNVRITPLRYNRFAKALFFLRVPVPYCLQGGPTYISTNHQETYEQLTDLVRRGRKI